MASQSPIEILQFGFYSDLIFDFERWGGFIN
jgi:hypothetical protein